MNKNFLNNQNYILGKSEKKKLLSKFFVENNILFFLNLFQNIKIIFSKNVKLGNKVFIPIYGWGFLVIYILFTGLNIFYFILSIIFPILLIFILKYLALRKTKYKKDLVEISSFKNLFFRKELNMFGTFILFSIYLSPPLIIFLQLLNDNSSMALYVLIFFVLAIIFKKYLESILKLKFYFVLFLPFLIILEIFIGIYYYFKFVIFGIKSFTIIKLFYKNNLLDKFLLLDKNYAENEYYRIELKNKKT